MLKTMSKFQGVLKMFKRNVENHVENHVEVQKSHNHTLWCVLKLSGRGLKIRWQMTSF